MQINFKEAVMGISNIKQLGGISKVATRTFGKSLFVVKKYSPEIMTTAGVIGVVASAVLASKATLNLESIVDETRDNLGKAKDLHEQEREDYTESDYKKDMTTIYVQQVIKIGKLYAAPATLGLASIALIIGAHGIMRQRNVALVGAYKALETSFTEYRKRVANIIGVDAERDVRLGFEEVEVVDEEGNVTKATTINSNGLSQYARFFDEHSSNWDKDPEYNLMFLRAAQNQANDKLHAYGHLFLNDVYKALGIPISQEGQLVGWSMKSEHGDGFVDFGIYDFNDDRRAFVNGLERSILLDFNVDGFIQDKI
jgi:hypothetical protein